MNIAQPIVSSLTSAVKFYGGLPKFLKNSISYDQAKSIIARRADQREENFINFMHRCIFTFSSSPYLPLLRDAGCSSGDVEHEVKKYGIEHFLKDLKEAGVWISADEYKGRKAVKRKNFERLFEPDAFNGPDRVGRLTSRSGGSSGRPTRTHMFLSNLSERACYDAIMFKMLNLYETPIALWLPRLPGLSNTLRFSKIGQPPQRLFVPPADKIVLGKLKNRLTTRALGLIGRGSGTTFPDQEPLDFDDPTGLLEWMLQMLKTHGRVAVRCFASQAVRTCLAASERGADLAGTVFVVGGEPLSRAKFDQIKKVNAHVFSRYVATELGTIAMGCGQTSEIGDYHLVSDMIAMIQDETTRAHAPGRPLYFTGFVGSVPKILLNADIGDTGVVQRRQCGCLFGELGFDTHLTQVSNYAKTSADALSVETSVLRHIVEEVLPVKYRGSPLDYQWVEVEDHLALTRLKLRVHPRLGPLDESCMKRDILDEFMRQGPAIGRYAATWNETNSLQIERTPPSLTAGGKLVPFLKMS